MNMSQVSDNPAETVLLCHSPENNRAAPLVVDSPHSGTAIPADFSFDCPREWILAAADSHVADLFSAAPSLGAPLLEALFPRAYIDVNRAVDDIDPHILAGVWPGRLNPTIRSDMGFGLIRRFYKSDKPDPLYKRKLGIADVKHRINTCYIPYHDKLAGLLDSVHGQFDVVCHLNVHSMPSATRARGAELADIVLGDRDGATCPRALTAFVAATLEGMGYRVSVNDPYKGAEIIRRHAAPARKRNSLQVEIRRNLYMDERTLEKTEGFKTVQRDMTTLMEHLVDFISENN